MNDDWTLVYEGFEPKTEGLREALCTLGNGQLATRGAAEESSADEIHYPGTYLAGGYNRLPSQVGGRTIVNEDLVNFPNWLALSFRPEGGQWLDLSQVQVLSYRQELRLLEGVLRRHFRVRDAQGKETEVQSRRFVSMRDAHLAGIEYKIRPINWSGTIQIRSALDGSVINAGVPRYRQLSSKHLRVLGKGAVEDGRTMYVLAQTVQSRLEVAMAARTDIYRGDQPASARSSVQEKDETISQELTLYAQRDDELTVEKLVAVYSNRSHAISHTALSARAAVSRCGRFSDLLQRHRTVWGFLWKRCDAKLELAKKADPAHARDQLVLRLHIFHLLQTGCMNTVGLDVSMPPRGLHGEAYRGHIFWDELFIFPFYNARLPQVTRSALLYRYHRLNAAREYARENGYRGAMYPWQTGSDGQEETQIVHYNPNSGRWGPDHSRRQRHVNVAIVYNIWQYYIWTGDREFLEHYGAEMILEIVRFWVSATRLNPDTGRYEIHGVMGPDEYHENYPGSEEGGLRNNAYTNVMVVWCIKRALETLELLPPESGEQLKALLGLTEEEIALWPEIAREMTIPFHEGNIIGNFEGYAQLKEFDWRGYRDKYGDIARLDRILKAKDDNPDHYKVSKQADAVMLFYLLSPRQLQAVFEELGCAFGETDIDNNVEYYVQRTSHGSTLSKIVFGYVLYDIDRERSSEFCAAALRSDIEDVQGGTTPEGVHLGVMSGTVDMVLRKYMGVSADESGLSIQPRLPEHLAGIQTRLKYRNSWLELKVSRSRVRVAVLQGAPGPVPVLVNGKLHRVAPGKERGFRC